MAAKKTTSKAPKAVKPEVPEVIENKEITKSEEIIEEVPAVEEIAEPKAAEKVAEEISEEHIVLAKIYPNLSNSKYRVYVEYGEGKQHEIARRSYSKALIIAQSWCKTHGHSFSDIKVI